MWSGFFGDREPANISYLRLRANRLPEAYFPYRDYNYQSPKTMDEWVQLRKSDEDERLAWQREHPARQGDREELWTSTPTHYLGLFPGPLTTAELPEAVRIKIPREMTSGRRLRTSEIFYDFLESTSKDILPPLTSWLKVFSDGKWETESTSSWTNNQASEDASTKTTKSTEEWIKDGASPSQDRDTEDDC